MIVMPRGNSDPIAVSPEEQRRSDAVRMLFRHQFEGKPLATCWTEVHPDSKLDPETARHRATKELEWLRRNHPLRIDEVLPLYDLDTASLIDDLENQLGATKSLVVRVIKDGQTTVRRETIEVPDNRARSRALDQLIEISGLSRSGKSSS